MGNMINTREQLAKITQAVAMSIDHARLSEDLEGAGLSYDMDETDASNRLANQYMFAVSGSNHADEDGDGITFTLALVSVDQAWSAIDVTQQKHADIEGKKTEEKNQ